MDIYVNAFLDRNMGDDLMVRLAAQTMPQHTFHLPTSNEALLYPFSDLKNIKGGAKPLSKHFNPSSYDALLTIGGSMFLLGSSKVIINRYLNTVKAIRKMKREEKKIATIGSNIGPLRKLGIKVAVEQIKPSGLVTLRDTASKQRLAAHDVDSLYFPDMLFSLPVHTSSERSGLAISSFRGGGNEDMYYYRALAKIADGYHKNTGKAVRFLCFDCESQNDICAAFTIRSLMKHPECAEIIPYIYDAEPIFRAIGQSEAMLSTRFHSCVFAITSQTPMIPISYSSKTDALLDDINYKGIRLPFGEIDSVTINSIIYAVSSGNGLFSLSPDVLDRLVAESRGHMRTLSEYFS